MTTPGPPAPSPGPTDVVVDGAGGGDDVHRDGGPLFWVTAVVGWCIIAGAVAGAFTDRRDAQPLQLVRWVIGGALVHDLLWLPLVGLIAVAVSRGLRGRAPRIINWALASSAVLVLVAWPFVRGYGRQAGNPSLLPRNYGAGLAAYLVGIWIVAIVAVAVGVIRRRRASGAPSAGRTHPDGLDRQDFRGPRASPADRNAPERAI